MAKERNAQVVRRCLELLQALGQARQGLRVDQLEELLQVSRSTVYRTLALLQGTQWPVDKRGVNGEARYLIDAGVLPPSPEAAGELAFLEVVVAQLAPLEGTALHRVATRALRDHRVAHARRRGGPGAREGGEAAADHPALVKARRRAVGRPEILAALEEALERGRRLRLRYAKGAAGEDAGGPAAREVDPIALRLAGDQLYLLAWDRGRRAARMFKVARMIEAAVLRAAAEAHPEVDAERELEHAVTAWTGDPIDVVVWLDAAVAGKAAEWPLHEAQRVEPGPGGGALVRARVNGLRETLRWTLGWGRDAEAREPEALRALVAEELEAAAGRYRGGEAPPETRAGRGRS